MNATESSLSRLDVATAVVNARASTIFSINGVDLLDSQRPRHRPDGSLYPSGPKTFLPVDPADVLPPDSAVLFPFDVPREVMVGVCDCGEPGCGSLWLQARRDGAVVVWEPDLASPRSSIDTTWRFDLVQYLDAIACGSRSLASWESRPRLLAREMRRRRDSLFGFWMGSSLDGSAAELVRARAWPERDEISITAVGRGRRFLRVTVPDHLSDEEIIAAVQRLDPDVVRPDE